jgi:hypothetical protein
MEQLSSPKKPIRPNKNEQDTLTPTRLGTRALVLVAFGFLAMALLLYFLLQPTTQTSVLTNTQTASGTLLFDPQPVVPEPIAPQPTYLTPWTDPVFHSTVTRIAGNSGTPFTLSLPTPSTGAWSTDVRHHYSKDQPWNADQTLLAIENKVGGDTIPVFLNGETYQPVSSRCSTYSSQEDRWHPNSTHKNERINIRNYDRSLDPDLPTSISGRRILEWYDITTCTRTRRWLLPFAVDYMGPNEGNPSNDGRFLALQGVNPSTNKISMFVVDMDPQSPLAPYPSQRIGPVVDIETNCGLSTCNNIDWASVSASGKYAVVSYDGDHPRVFNVNSDTLQLSQRAMPANSKQCSGHDPAKGYIFDLGHADFALNSFDVNPDPLIGQEDYLIGQLRNWCTQTTDDKNQALGSAVMVRLRDDFVMTLTKKTVNGVEEATAHHISTRNIGRPDWVFVSYHGNTGVGRRYYDEIIAVKMTGPALTEVNGLNVEHFAQKHGVYDSCYRCETHAVPSRDGFRAIFASTWTLNCTSNCGTSGDIKPYVVDTRPLRVTDTAPPTGDGNVNANSLFNDNFESGTTKWTPLVVNGVAKGSWRRVLDETQVYKQETEAGDAWSIAGLHWSDYSVEARIKPLTTSSSGFVGLFGRWKDYRNFYYLKIIPCPTTQPCSTSKVELKQMLNGTNSTLQSANISLPMSSWHTFKLEMRGGNLRVFIDGATTPILVTTSSTFTAGKIAVGTDNATATFDDVAAVSIASGGSGGGGGGGKIRIPE